MKSKKISNVALDSIVIAFDRNVREQNVESYEDPGMQDSLAMIGQQTIGKLLKRADGTHEPIQGNRRAWNLKKLREKGVLDPKTAKRDENGNILRDDKGRPIGAKVFEFMEAEVYEGLSERERVELLFDTGSTRSLNKAELFYAIEFLFDAGYSEKEVVIQGFGLLKQHYPPSRNIKETTTDGGQDAFEYFRGVVQTLKDAWRSPVVVRDAWVDKLKTGRKWPIKSDMVQAYKTFSDEMKADKTGKINRRNPGPKFTEYWDKLVAKNTKAEASGEKRGKASSIMNRTQIEDRLGTLDSRALKALVKMILRELPEDQMPVLDAAMVQFEAGKLEVVQLGNVLDAIFASGEEPEEEKKEEEKKDEAA